MSDKRAYVKKEDKIRILLAQTDLTSEERAFLESVMPIVEANAFVPRESFNRLNEMYKSRFSNQTSSPAETFAVHTGVLQTSHPGITINVRDRIMGVEVEHGIWSASVSRSKDMIVFTRIAGEVGPPPAPETPSPINV